MSDSTLIKVYCGELIPNIPYLEILNPNLGFKKRKNIFGDKDIFDDFTDPIVDVVNDPEQSDYLLIPHNYFQIKNNEQYLNNFKGLSKKYSKKIIIFAIGDSSEEINILNSIVLRMSQYKSKKKDNEIIIPAYAADLSYSEQVLFRTKQEKPIVGFCGWAKMNGFLQKLSFYIKNSFLQGPYKQGLYFRKKALSAIKNSALIRSNLIIRSSYGANDKTIELDPKQAREQYRKNIIESDFVLAPKGDGNYSVRFYEILSLGRVPILIDTDCPLPLEGKIDYSKFMLKISYKDIYKMDKIISDFYKKISNEEWLKMQELAKETFDKNLRIDIFFRNLLTKENLNR